MEDSKLLELIMKQAGPIVHNALMAKGMELLARDLQLSREQLVLSREEERRKLRSNLHDDLAPRLAALALNAAAAEKYVKNDPEAAEALMSDLRHVIRTAIGDIRTIVHDLRPPCLDELGLIAAIAERLEELGKLARQTAETSGGVPLRIGFEAPEQLPALPAAVEVAAYRIVTESLVNVIRHAQATECIIAISIKPNNQLRIEVTDNGLGIDGRKIRQGTGGIGLGSIRERAAELGGHCVIEKIQPTGTRIIAHIPFSGEATA